MTLSWQRGDDYHLRTECGSFTISRAVVAAEVVYTAWDCRRRPALALYHERRDGADIDSRRAAVEALQRLCAEAAG